jgi:hypothetical protein
MRKSNTLRVYAYFGLGMVLSIVGTILLFTVLENPEYEESKISTKIVESGKVVRESSKYQIDDLIRTIESIESAEVVIRGNKEWEKYPVTGELRLRAITQNPFAAFNVVHVVRNKYFNPHDKVMSKKHITKLEDLRAKADLWLTELNEHRSKIQKEAAHKFIDEGYYITDDVEFWKSDTLIPVKTDDGTWRDIPASTLFELAYSRQAKYKIFTKEVMEYRAAKLAASMVSETQTNRKGKVYYILTFYMKEPLTEINMLTRYQEDVLVELIMDVFNEHNKEFDDNPIPLLLEEMMTKRWSFNR